jgi:hypothetical protein
MMHPIEDGLELMAALSGMSEPAAIIVRDAYECGDAEHIDAAPAPAEVQS